MSMSMKMVDRLFALERGLYHTLKPLGWLHIDSGMYLDQTGDTYERNVTFEHCETDALITIEFNTKGELVGFDGFNSPELRETVELALKRDTKELPGE